MERTTSAISACVIGVRSIMSTTVAAFRSSSRAMAAMVSAGLAASAGNWLIDAAGGGVDGIGGVSAPDAWVSGTRQPSAIIAAAIRFWSRPGECGGANAPVRKVIVGKSSGFGSMAYQRDAVADLVIARVPIRRSLPKPHDHGSRMDTGHAGQRSAGPVRPPRLNGYAAAAPSTTGRTRASISHNIRTTHTPAPRGQGW